MRLKPRDIERFLGYVHRGEPTACWLWTGTKDKAYGSFSLPDGYLRAHRAAMSIHLGRDLCRGENVLHKCDVPLCCNPAHLYIGTQAQNIADRVARGRSNRPRGSCNGRAVLTEEDVRQIRKDYRGNVRKLFGGPTYQQLAVKYRVELSAIYKIIKGITWAHIK